MVHVFVNAAVLGLELALIAAAAWLGFVSPLGFAAACGVVALGLGAWLELARLRHELPFYRPRLQAVAAGAKPITPVTTILLTMVASVTTLGKVVLAAGVGLMTFAGTDDDRRWWIALAFAATVFAGSSVLRRFDTSFGVHPGRWGFFRLALPLGLVFSSLLAGLQIFGVLKSPALGDLGRQILFETAAKPTIAQAGELVFQLKQYIDQVMLTLLSTVLPTDVAQVAVVAVSANVLTGFVASTFAVLAASMVRVIERR